MIISQKFSQKFLENSEETFSVNFSFSIDRSDRLNSLNISKGTRLKTAGNYSKLSKNQFFGISSDKRIN